MKKSPAHGVRKRISFEKKVAMQAVAAIIFLSYGILVSKTGLIPGHKEFIHRVVNVSSGKSDITDMMNTLGDLSEKAVAVCGKYFDRMVYFCNNGFGTPPDSGEVLAREYADAFIPLDGIFAEASIGVDPKLWAADGVHPTAAGHDLIKQQWLSTFMTML